LPVSCPPLDQSLPVPIVWAGCRSTQRDEAERQFAGAAGNQCFRCAVTGRRNSWQWDFQGRWKNAGLLPLSSQGAVVVNRDITHSGMSAMFAGCFPDLTQAHKPTTQAASKPGRRVAGPPGVLLPWSHTSPPHRPPGVMRSCEPGNRVRTRAHPPCRQQAGPPGVMRSWGRVVNRVYPIYRFSPELLLVVSTS